MSFNSISNQLKNIVREGIVSVTYPRRHSCRVTFPDRSGLVSAELPVLTFAAFKNTSYGLPDIGERVVCLMTSNDESGHGGYILGSLYSSNNLPDEIGQDLTRLTFFDNAEVSYKRATDEDKTSTFKMKMADDTQFLYECEGNKFEFNFKFSDGCQISYNERAEFEIRFKDKSTITHDLQRGLEFDIKGEINISAKGDIALRGANIHLN